MNTLFFNLWEHIVDSFPENQDLDFQEDRQESFLEPWEKSSETMVVSFHRFS